MLALDGNTLAGGSLTFLLVSARPLVPRIWPGPLPGPWWIWLAGEEGEAGGRVRAWCRPVPCCRWVVGSEKRGPLGFTRIGEEERRDGEAIALHKTHIWANWPIYGDCVVLAEPAPGGL